MRLLSLITILFYFGYCKQNIINFKQLKGDYLLFSLKNIKIKKSTIYVKILTNGRIETNAGCNDLYGLWDNQSSSFLMKKTNRYCFAPAIYEKYFFKVLKQTRNIKKRDIRLVLFDGENRKIGTLTSH